ncbi:MAG: hypothetical protein GC205_08560 [Bacteroidetes bacterium]|nr:hypothetical protein [Bacteroidota bacterium]
MKQIVLYIYFLLFLVPLRAQVKFEQERKIAQQVVPDTAQKVVNEISTGSRIKWYQEQRLDGISYEAKYTLNGRRYSVEFNHEGELEDVEIELKWKEVPLSAAKAMEAHFDSAYLKHRLRKVQEQLSGSLSAIQEHWERRSETKSDGADEGANSAVRASNTINKVLLRYEVVVQVRTAEGAALHEVLFDEQGQMLQTATILLRNTDNLVY